MANMKRLAIFLPVAVILGYAFFLAVLMIRVKPEEVKKSLTLILKSYRGTSLQLQGFDLSYFPALKVRAREIVLEIQGDPHVKFSGKNFSVVLSPWPLLFGNTVIQSMDLEDGDLFAEAPQGAAWQNLALSNIVLKVGKVRPRRPIDFELKAAFSDVPNALSLKGFFSLEKLQDWKWRDINLEGAAQFHHIILASLSRTLRMDSSTRIADGQLESTVHFVKKQAYSEMAFQGDVSLDQMTYEIREGSDYSKSPPIKASMHFDLGWNPESDILSFKKTTVTSPLGKLEAIGKLAMNTREFKDFRVTASEISIENFPQYILPLKKIIPFNIGFSGSSVIEMSLDGSVDHVSMDANWDLTPTLLTYGRYFLKPKDFPMSVLFNCLIEKGKELSGDFSLRLQSTSFKGTLTHFDFQHGGGELNMITNKFKLTGWEVLVPPLAGLMIDGEMKVLVNWAGDTQAANPGQNILNLTVENGSLTGKDWPGVKRVNFGLDISPFSMELKKASWGMMDSSLVMDLVIYNLWDNPNLKGKLSSPNLKLAEILQPLEKIGGKFWPDVVKSQSVEIYKLANRLFPHDESIKNVEAAFHYQKQILSVDSLVLEAYGGKGKGIMKFYFSKTPVTYEVNTEINKLSLARYLGRAESGPQAISGNLFLNAHFSGTQRPAASFEKSITGDGMFSVTNGEFGTFDILNAIGEIDGFGEVGLLSNKKTGFDDLHGKFIYQDEKIKMEDMTLLSPDLVLEASGELLPGGLLNYRINAFLSTTLTTHFLTPLLGKMENFQDKQFGPIPLLLSGLAIGPEIKADARQLEELKENLERKKAQKILRNFVPEEAVFKVDSLDLNKKAA
ncbi:MAG: hypothetical protein EXS63_06655 [Candidatus Omnitrophica bacterium]|nr:hypothetical protein [Candidatus Omnitrophota bacterium]